MQIATTRFGPLTIDPATVIHFPLGLLGFETRQRFVLLDSDEVAPMRWLQSVDDPALSFLVVDPTLLFAEYAVTLTADDVAVLDAGESDTPAALCLVVVPPNPREMTVNLLGPLVLNADKRLGKQVVLHDSGYSPAERLFPDTAPSQEAALV